MSDKLSMNLLIRDAKDAERESVSELAKSLMPEPHVFARIETTGSRKLIAAQLRAVADDLDPPQPKKPGTRGGEQGPSFDDWSRPLGSHDDSKEADDKPKG